MAEKLIDAADLGAPLPAWRWLVWFRPTFGNPPLDGGHEYLVYGTDDLAAAEARASENPGYFVAQNPIWRTLN